MKKNVFISILIFFLFQSLTLLKAQNSLVKSEISLEQIMNGNDFIGYSPSRPIWSFDEKNLYFQWKRDTDRITKWYTYSIKNNMVTPTSLTERNMEIPDSKLKWNSSRDKAFIEQNGNIYLWDPLLMRKTILIDTETDESEAIWANTGKGFYFKQNNQFYYYRLDSFQLKQKVFVRSAKNDVRTRPKSGSEKWIEEDNMAQFDVLRSRKEQKEELRKYNLEPSTPKGFPLNDREIAWFRINPNGKFAVICLAERNQGKSTEVPDFMAEDGYLTNSRYRSKVGTGKTNYELYIIDLEKDTFFSPDFNTLPGIFKKPNFLSEYHKDTTRYNPDFKTAKSVYPTPISFSPDGRFAVLELFSQDNKDRWIVNLTDSFKIRTLDHQHDEAWIGNIVTGLGDNLQFLKDGKSIFFLSEKTGFAHLYSIDIASGKMTTLTSGNFELHNVDYDFSLDQFYIHTGKGDPRVSHFYTLKNGIWKNILGAEGKYEATVSPSGKFVAALYSNATQPPELFLHFSNGALISKLTKSTRLAFDSVRWAKPNYISFKASDGQSVPARLYRNPNANNGAAVIFVHGAGYLQNAHKGWSTYFREYMFHNLLIQKGYTVIDIDYRASAGYGRDWRTGIYRHMGGKDLSDHLDGVKYLIDSLGVAKDKIGIYGGSYGGFITLMALFNHPGVFKCGAALRSVTDWAHYNHGYTSNILNTPIEDPTAYKKSSPIYFAQGLQDRLLMLHGMYDTNVQFQDIVRLSQKLIELKKSKWELAVYPVEDHGFRENSSWYDEYSRILRLFEEELGGTKK